MAADPCCGPTHDAAAVERGLRDLDVDPIHDPSLADCCRRDLLQQLRQELGDLLGAPPPDLEG